MTAVEKVGMLLLLGILYSAINDMGRRVAFDCVGVVVMSAAVALPIIGKACLRPSLNLTVLHVSVQPTGTSGYKLSQTHRFYLSCQWSASVAGLVMNATATSHRPPRRGSRRPTPPPTHIWNRTDHKALRRQQQLADKFVNSMLHPTNSRCIGIDANESPPQEVVSSAVAKLQSTRSLPKSPSSSTIATTNSSTKGSSGEESPASSTSNRECDPLLNGVRGHLILVNQLLRDVNNLQASGGTSRFTRRDSTSRISLMLQEKKSYQDIRQHGSKLHVPSIRNGLSSSTLNDSFGHSYSISAKVDEEEGAVVPSRTSSSNAVEDAKSSSSDTSSTPSTEADPSAMNQEQLVQEIRRLRSIRREHSKSATLSSIKSIKQHSLNFVDHTSKSSQRARSFHDCTSDRTDRSTSVLPTRVRANSDDATVSRASFSTVKPQRRPRSNSDDTATRKSNRSSSITNLSLLSNRVLNTSRGVKEKCDVVRESLWNSVASSKDRLQSMDWLAYVQNQKSDSKVMEEADASKVPPSKQESISKSSRYSIMRRQSLISNQLQEVLQKDTGRKVICPCMPPPRPPPLGKKAESSTTDDVVDEDVSMKTVKPPSNTDSLVDEDFNSICYEVKKYRRFRSEEFKLPDLGDNPHVMRRCESEGNTSQSTKLLKGEEPKKDKRPDPSGLSKDEIPVCNNPRGKRRSSSMSPPSPVVAASRTPDPNDDEGDSSSVLSLFSFMDGMSSTVLATTEAYPLKAVQFG